MRLFTALLIPLFATTSLAATARTIYQFPNQTWIENLIPTRNNSLLVTIIGRAEVYLVNPNLPVPTASLIATFPNATSVLGIAELENDLYAVGVGSTTPDNQPVPRSFSVWTIDLLPRDKPAKIEKVVDVPDMQLINGVVALNPHTLLLADSFAGNIVKLDVKSRTYGVVLQDKSLEPDFSASLPIGVNGIRLDGSTLFYSNTVQNLTGKVPINTLTGKSTGAFKTIAKNNGIAQPDDFAVSKDQNLYLVSPVRDTLWRVKQSGKVEVLLQGGDVSGATSAVFARKGGKTLYLSTSGLVGGVPTRGGRVVAVDL